MSSLLPLAGLLWAQAGAAAAAQDQGPSAPVVVQWLFVWGEPRVTVEGTFGGLMTWVKVVALFALVGWTMAWVLTAVKEGQARHGYRLRPLDIAALAALAVAAVAAWLSVLVANGRLDPSLANLPTYLGVAGGAVVLLWIENKLWSVLRRRGRPGDIWTLIAMHAAVALGMAIGVWTQQAGAQITGATWRDGLYQGARLSATYMGLVVLARLASLLWPELLALRWRRLYAIAWHTWTEAFRRMWAPWVVIVLFAVILAFTAWFLQPPRPAEMGRLYVGTLMLLSAILLTLLIVFLVPISLPNDIRQQTIYTIVSKPARRLELLWGRMLGAMALVTVLLLLFGGVSLIYFHRMIGAQIREARQRAEQFERTGKTELARQSRDQAEQLETRMSARVPIYGSLIFYDSRGNLRRRGIDVGLELPLRSFVEGATPSRAIWRYGSRIPNPYNPSQILNRRVPIERFLVPGTIEYLENQRLELLDRAALAEATLKSGSNVKAADAKRLNETVTRDRNEAKQLEARVAALRKEEASRRAKRQSTADLHSPPIPVEMAFTIYRTTKGEVGEPVYASLIVTNQRPGSRPESFVLPVREYYNNRRLVPSRVLVGSHGELHVEIKCLTPNQYIGMAEGDLFLLSHEGRFSTNYLRGLFGIWLQAMVLTAIGVFAGTFLSWPVALLMTVFFFVAGNVGFTELQKFALSAELLGGGPFESLIRTLSHENLMSELEPTPAVVLAKTLDSIVVPVMARLVYIVPNFTALDFSALVADGFAVQWAQLAAHLLLAVAYALPFSIAGYFILKEREVAA